MGERVQKWIAASGLMSRRAAEELIAAGRVTLDGHPARLGDRAETAAQILVDGAPLPEPAEKLYIALYKPRGFVTSLRDEKGRRDVSMLLRELGVRLFPVGRLDMDSEGLLIMTNDGDLAQKLMHPSHEVDKCYRVWVRCEDIEAGLARLVRPMELDGRIVQAGQVELEQLDGQEARILVTIHEGRNRQVRRMCASSGMTVSRLCRISEGPVRLGALQPGQWRHLSREELEQIGWC